jgi:hypothetical protein
MRFSSLNHVPAQTRKTLRDRFDSLLRTQHYRHQLQKDLYLDDEQVLRFLQLLQINFNCDFAYAMADYNEIKRQLEGIPTFDELIETGWIRVIHGRISSLGPNARYALSRVPENQQCAINELMENRYLVQYSFGNEIHQVTALSKIADQIERGEIDPERIGCLCTKWVAARLWDRAYPNSTNAVDLQWWADRWDLLHRPLFAPSFVWEDSRAKQFIESVLDVLHKDETLVNWVEFRALAVKQVSLINGQVSDSFIADVPATLVDRFLWMNNKIIEDILMLSLADRSAIWSLIRLLLEEVNCADDAPAPHKVAKEVFELALERPEALEIVRAFILHNSRLLADLVLFPSTSVLACVIIAQWRVNLDAWDREVLERDYLKNQLAAFNDAVEVMGYFLQKGEVNPAEVGALLVWMHKHARTGFIGRQGRNSLEKMLASLRECLSNQPQAILERIYATLEEREGLGLGEPAFAAAIDIVTVGALEGTVRPDRIIQSYIQSIRTGDYTLSAHQINQTGAVTLVKLAQRTSGDQWKMFLTPLAIKEWLAVASDSGKNMFSIKEGISRSLRAHIRILCRAIAAWGDNPPDDLLLALINMVKVGAYEHVEKGRVSAFAANFETNHLGDPIDKPIADDLIAVLRSVKGHSSQELLEVILTIDEPLTLAHLLTLAPQSCRSKIEERLCKLTPEEAAEVWSLSQVQSRIDALLTAGVASVAATYINVEQNLKTFGNVLGRKIDRLRANLRLNLIQHDWDTIAKTKLPPDLSHAELEAARDSICFYKAVAELQKPNGRPELAVSVFENLCRKQSDIPAYILNLFAARISTLLKEDIFCLLIGEKAVLGREALSEAQRKFAGLSSVSRTDQELYELNKALLLLALGQVRAAYDTLFTIKSEQFQDTITAYTAVALFRSGEETNALTMLERARIMMDGSKVIEAAWAHIKGREIVNCRVNFLTDENLIEKTSVAYTRLVHMNPFEQAKVIDPCGELWRLIFEYVRTSTAGVTALVPMMDKCEDDLSALLREILIARFLFLRWSICDQSKGGYSKNENPGERDILIKNGNATLAVIEAVRCNKPISQQAMLNDLASHFQKLFGYSECWYFIHLTYCYLDDGVESVLEALRLIAENQVPDGVIYEDQSSLPDMDSSPQGFIARYKRDGQEALVLFLVLDLKQDVQRQASKTAAKTKVKTKAKMKNG